MSVIYILLGPPATGKTSFSTSLASHISSPLVSFDSVAKTVSTGGSDLSYRQTRAVGEKTVGSLILSGAPAVVVEDTFHLRSLRKSFVRCLPPGTKVKWVHFVGELAVLLERNRKRATDVSEESLKKVFTMFQSPGSEMKGEGVPVFERGNVVHMKDGMSAEDVVREGGFWVKEDAAPPPPLAQHQPQDVFDLTLRKLVSLCVSKDVSRAKHANDVRKSVLKLRKEDKSEDKSMEYGEADAVRMWGDAKGDDVTTDYAELSQSSTPRPDLPEEPPPPPSDPNAFTPEETAAIISNLRTFGFTSSPSDLTSLILAKGGKSHKDWEHTIACGGKMMECLGGMER
jgi:hypothetical protein